jgi:hypothetical protein
VQLHRLNKQGARKKVLDNWRRTAVNRADMSIKTIVVLLVGLALTSASLAQAQPPYVRIDVASGNKGKRGEREG